MGSDKAYTVSLSRKASKDLQELLASDLRDKAIDMLELLTEDPFQKSNSFEKLRGDLDGCYSRRLNAEHRVVYEILPDESGDSKGIVHVLRMKSHYRGILSLFFL